jgi:drug/metabolite transporter (DMT)-like permease
MQSSPQPVEFAMTQHLRGILALLLVTVVWGTTFPAMKELSEHFTPAWIIFVRFALAAVLLAPFLLRGTRADIGNGLLLGLVLFLCFGLQVEGLARTSSNRNAFLTGLNVLVVPLIGIALGRKPTMRIVCALLLALLGLFALCYDTGAWTMGDTLSLGCALGYGAYVLLMEVRTRRATSILTLTAAQILAVAVCAGLWVGLHEVPRLPVGVLNDWDDYWRYIGAMLRQYWINFAYLGAVCTAAIISLQSWGQQRTSANDAAVIYAFEPGAAAVFGYFWLGEALGDRGWLGAALLISGMIVSQWNSTARPAASLAPE